MLIGALLTPKTAAALEAARSTGEVVWSRVREPGAGDPRQEFAELARTAADVILLDADAAPAEALMAGVRQLRLLHRARVLVLAPGAQPGHRGIDLLVGLGVYDILAPQEAEPDWGALIGQALSGPPPTYAHIARWHVSAAPPEAAADGGGDHQGGVRERVRIVRQVERVVERVPLAGRPAVVAVACTAPGAGATFAALTAAGYLARQGYRVALVEAAARPRLARLLHALGHPPAEPEGAEIVPGLTVYAQPIPQADTGETRDAGLRVLGALLAAGRDRHQYVVLDLGNVPAEEPELARADLALIVHGPAPWRSVDLERWLTAHPGQHWRLVFTPAAAVPPGIDVALREVGLSAHALPWLAPDPVPGYEAVEAAQAALADLLEPVLLRPTRPSAARRGLWARWIARKAARAAAGAAGAVQAGAGAAAALADGATELAGWVGTVGRWILANWLLWLGAAVALVILGDLGVPLGPFAPVARWLSAAGARVIEVFIMRGTPGAFANPGG